MDNNMKELSPDKFHLQAKMQEWLEANQEIYTDFKSKIQSILKNLLCDNHSKQIDDEAITLQSIILEVMTTEEGVATDEMIIKMVAERIGEDDCKNGFILDGFPRTLPQAEALEKMLAEKGINLDAVIEIQVPDEIIMERILGRYACMNCGAGYHDKFQKPKIYGVCDVCGGTNFYRRVDDNRTTVQNRLVNYRALTYPTIPFFEKKGLLRCVDGTGTIEAVSKKIDSVLGIA